MYKLYFDGASRKNPGPASYGFVIYNENDEITTGGYISRSYIFLGRAKKIDKKITM